MATIPAPTTIPNANNPPAPGMPLPPPQRPLWQAPVFVLGVAALAGVWFGRPLFPDCPARRVDRDLAAARQQLARPDGDADLVVKLASRALGACDGLPEKSGEAAFLLGSAYTRLGELAAATPAVAVAHWRKARQSFAQAAEVGVPEEDQPRLQYRTGKVELLLGENIPNAVALLEKSVPTSESRSEGYALLTQAYLRLPQPDLQKALEANQALRDVAEATEAEQTAAKLLGGELLLRLNKAEEARKSLEKIGEQAPPDILVRARLLRARSYQDEKNFSDAVRLYKAALADTRVPTPDPARVYYSLGLCYQALVQPSDATLAWQECIQLNRAPESHAAAFLLADVRLKAGSLESALELLGVAVGSTATPEAWRNELMDVHQARERFEHAATAFRSAHRYDLALKLLVPFARLAPQRRGLHLRGDICAEWAEHKLAQGTPAAAGATAEQEAQALYRQAADAYAAAAALPEVRGEKKGEFLWASARHYLTARDQAQAAARLEDLVKLELKPELLAEAWYRLGEVRRGKNDAKAATEAYIACMRYDTRFECLARHQLAVAALERGELEEAEAALVQNIKILRYEPQHEALPLSLSALSNLLYRRRDYKGVVMYLENLLTRLKDGPEATRARYQLADSYRQLAAQKTQGSIITEAMSPEKRTFQQKEHRRWLQKAADEFAALSAFLESPAGKDHLTKELRSQVPFIAAKCWFNLGQYDKSLKTYEKLILRFPDQVECLEALGGAVSCHAALGQIDRVKERLLAIKLLLPRMPVEVSKEWERWLEEAFKPLRKLEEERRGPAAAAAADNRGANGGS